MAFDIDPFNALDTNFDTQVDATDLKNYELANHGVYSVENIDHDLILDRYDMDLNNDGFADQFQADLDGNNLIDQFEQNIGATTLNHDINQDNKIDHIDNALAKSIYNL